MACTLTKPALKSKTPSIAIKATTRRPDNIPSAALRPAIPFLGTTTVGAGSIGSGYASFLLGQVQNYKVTPPQAAQQRSIQEGLYVQDNFKATSKLTLEIGLAHTTERRWAMRSGTGSRRSVSALPNPNAGNLPGGTVFAGYGTGRCNCEFVKTYNFGFGPRLSAAYQLNSKTVIRAGWGISYSASDQWNYLSNNYLTNGLGYTTISPGNNPQFGYAYSQLQNGIVYAPSALHVVNLNPGINSPVGALGSPSASAITYDPAARVQRASTNGTSRCSGSYLRTCRSKRPMSPTGAFGNSKAVW